MTPILGPATVNAQQAAVWAAQRGAPLWFCDLAPVYWQLAPTRGGVRPEVAYADFAKETGFGRFGGTDPTYSASQSMHNPAGLKTADGSATATFPDWWQGITAHLDHLALYAGAPGYPVAGSPDPRAFSYLLGVCPSVESLGGHWAPSADYGTTLVTDYITPLIGDTQVAAPTICPFAKVELISCNTGGAMAANIGLVVHEAEGDGDLYGWFNNPAAQVSAHFWVGKDGTLCQYVPVGTVAWAEMAGNDSYVSVETEGFATEPFTTAQIATLGKLITWGHQVYGWPLQLVDHGASGITTHCFYPSGQPDPAYGDHPCPGPIRLGQMPQVLAAATGSAPAPVPTPSTAPISEDYMKVVTAVDPATNASAEYLIRSTDVLHVPDNTCGSWAYKEFNGGQGALEAVPWEIILWLNNGQKPANAP